MHVEVVEKLRRLAVELAALADEMSGARPGDCDDLLALQRLDHIATGVVDALARHAADLARPPAEQP